MLECQFDIFQYVSVQEMLSLLLAACMFNVAKLWGIPRLSAVLCVFKLSVDL